MDTSNKKTRQKRSRIWLMPSDEFRQLVTNSQTYVAILRGLNYTERGGAFRVLKERITQENIDDSHIQAYKRTNDNLFQEIPCDDIFVENSTYNNGTSLKRKLLKYYDLDYICSVCGMLPEWNGSPLSLQLDHINGIRTDNRVENLRLICPNCHSQTDNFAGKNSSIVKPKNNCIDCDITTGRDSIRCVQCANKEIGSNKSKNAKFAYKKHNTPVKIRMNTRKVERPSKEELEKLLWEKPTTLIAKEYGVSDKAVGKWAKSYGIEKPPRGYWAKQHSLI